MPANLIAGSCLQWADQLPLPVEETLQLLEQGLLQAEAYEQGLVLWMPGLNAHAEWLAICTYDRKQFTQRHLKGWLNCQGLQSMHWALPLDNDDKILPWQWLLPNAGYRLTAQAQLVLDLQNPVAQGVLQKQQTALLQRAPLYQTRYRLFESLPPDHPLWLQVADVLQAAYANSPDMDWHATIRTHPVQVLQQQALQMPQHSLMAAFHDEELTGACVCYYPQPDLAQIGFWAVKPPFKGSGQPLLMQTLKQLPQTINRVEAYTHTRLNPVLKAYQLCGFNLANWQPIAYLNHSVY